MSLCYFEGQYLPLSETRLPVTDLSIQRGIGVFDSIRTYHRRPFAMTPHLKRLLDSAVASNMTLPATAEELSAIIREGLSRLEGEKLIRPYITGGDINKNGTFPEPRLFVLFEPLKTVAPEFYESGIGLYPLLDTERHAPLVKSIDYMAPYIARKGREDMYECLYIPRGEVTESTSSSFFLVTEGKLVTAPLGRVLESITRRIVIDVARKAGYKVEERCPRAEELAAASEAFIASTIKEVLAVVRVADIGVIGDGKPGPVAKHLRHLYLQAVNDYLE